MQESTNFDTTNRTHSMSEKSTPQHQPNNPLHGVKLATILEVLVENYGWEHLSYKININCFTHDPSIKSSLTFLRKTPWARTKVEELYLELLRKTNRPVQE